MRFTEEELKIIKDTFTDNVPLLKLLRKVFLPEYDHKAPLGQTVDLWMTLDLGSLTDQQAMQRIWARNTLITHIEQQLIQLNILAGVKEETAEEKKERERKDSTK